MESLSRDFIRVIDVAGAVRELSNRKFRLNAKQAKEIIDAARFIEEKRSSKRPKT